MTTLGRAYIEIVADGSNFGPSLRKEVEKQLDDITGKAAKKAGKKAGKQLDDETAKGIKDGAASVENAAADVGKKAGKKAASAAAKGVKEAGAQVEKEAGAVGRKAGKKFTTEMGSEVKKAGDEIGKVGDRIGDNFAGRFSSTFRRRWNRESRPTTLAVAAAFRGLVANARKWGNEAGGNFISSLQANVKKLEKGIGNLAGPPLKKLSAAVVGVAKAGELAGLSFAFWGTTIAALLPQILSLGAAAVSLSGLLLGLPAAIGPLVALFGTLKLATRGFADAVKATSPEQFAKATKDMGRNALQLVNTLRALKPEFARIGRAAQEAFSSGLAAAIRLTVLTISGPLKAGLANVGSALNALARQVLAFVRSASGIRLLHEWLQSAALGVRSLAANIKILLRGFSDLNNAIKPAMDKIISSAGEAAGRFGRWLSQISASGKAAKWFDDAVEVLRTLLQIVKNIGSALKSAFDASGESALSLLGFLKNLTGAIAAFFASAEGQKALTSFFQGIGAITTALQPVFQALGGVLVQVIPLIQQAIVALGPGLTVLVKGIGDALVALGPALVPVAQALSDVVVALAPQLPALAKAFADLLLAVLPLVPALTPLVVTLAQSFTDAIITLTPFIQDLVNWLAPLLKSFGENKDAVQNVALAYLGFKGTLLAFQGVATGIKLASLVTELGGLKTALKDTELAAKALNEAKFTKLATATRVFGALTTSLNAMKLAMIALVTETIPALVIALGEATAAMIGLDIAMDTNPIGVIVLGIAALVAIIAALVIGIIALVKNWDSVVQFFKDIPHWLAVAWNAVVDFFKAVPGALSTAWDAVKGFFVDIAKSIGEFFKGLGTAFLDFVTAIPGAIVDFLSAAWGAIWGFLTSLPGLAVKALNELVKGMLYALGAGIALLIGVFILLPINMIGALIEAAPKILAWFEDLVKDIGNWLVQLGVTVINFFTDLWNSTVETVKNWLNAIIEFFAALPARIGNWLVQAGLWIENFFIDLWHSTVQTVKDWLNAIIEFFANFPENAKKWFIEFEMWIGQFFIDLWHSTVKTVGDWIDAIVDFFAKLPHRIWEALKDLGKFISDPFKDAANLVIKAINKIIEGFDDMIAKFPGGDKLRIPQIPLPFHSGGVVPGFGYRDEVPAMLRRGEGILTPEAVRRLGGPAAVYALNRSATAPRRRGGVQHFGLGGIVDAASSAWAVAKGFGREALRFLTDPQGWLSDALNSIPGWSSLSNSTFGQFLTQMPAQAMNLALDKVKELFNTAKSTFEALSAGVVHGAGAAAAAVSANTRPGGNLAGWIASAINLTGVGQDWAGPLTVLIMRESGGDPNSINTWDINARNGDPSRGLMQTIGATFEAYRDPRLPDNIYDPIANIVAGIRYILARYGSIFYVQQANPNLPPRGYSLGGIIDTPQLAALHTNEVVLPLSRPERAIALSNESGFTDMLAGSLGGRGTVINAPITVTAPQSDPELVAWRVSSQIARLAASGVG